MVLEKKFSLNEIAAILTRRAIKETGIRGGRRVTQVNITIGDGRLDSITVTFHDERSLKEAENAKMLSREPDMEFEA